MWHANLHLASPPPLLLGHGMSLNWRSIHHTPSHAFRRSQIADSYLRFSHFPTTLTTLGYSCELPHSAPLTVPAPAELYGPASSQVQCSLAPFSLGAQFYPMLLSLGNGEDPYACCSRPVVVTRDESGLLCNQVAESLLGSEVATQ